MDKAQLAAIPERDSGPIEPHLAALAEEGPLFAPAAVLCLARIEEAAPALLSVLEKAARGEALSKYDEHLLFRGLHILGGARRAEAFAPLMQMLRRPIDDVKFLLGDAMAETLPRILAGVFDGDVDMLFAAIEDASIDEYVRYSLLRTATFLTWDKRIARETFRQFLEHLSEERSAPAGDYIWVGWAYAVAMLAERGLAEAVREAFAQELISRWDMKVKRFEALLVQAEQAPDDIGRFEQERLGYFHDVVFVLEGFGKWAQSVGVKAEAEGVLGDVRMNFEASRAPPQPAANLFRHIGRNAACPCGSGKKFKKCCLR